MERAIEIFAVIHLGVMGLSHILAPKAWIEFFIRLREKGHPGVFAVGFMSLFFGSIIAAFHNVWSGLGSYSTPGAVAPKSGPSYEDTEQRTTPSASPIRGPTDEEPPTVSDARWTTLSSTLKTLIT